eukprot:g1299.t1
MLKQQVLPSVVSFSSAVSACEKSLRWEMALRLMDWMRSESVLANQVTYNSVISACEKGQQWQQAMLSLWSMPKALAAQAKERPPREAASVTAERHRRTSLKLQHEVAELWEALRQYREKAQRDCEAVVSKQDLAKEELLQAFKSRDSTRYLVALEAALEAEVEPQDIPCVYSLHRVSGSFEVHEIDLRRRTFSAQLCFILDYTSSMKTQVQEVKSAVPRIIEAVRQLHLPLTPNARVDLEMSCVAYNDWDEDTFRLGRPVVAIFQGQEIRHAHGEPLLREEDFNLGGEFTRKAEALEAWIDQGLGHGGFVPEELTGALLAASYLPWNAENESEPSACAKLAVVITDAPCHGKAYSAVAHDVFCDRSTGLTCSGCPEVPLRRLREQGVQVAIFHTGEGPAVSMCEKLCASEPDLIHEKVDPSATAQKLVNLLEGKLKLQPLSYVLKTFSLGQPETPHLDLALAHDMEVEDGDGQKERYKIGLDGLLFLGFPERNPKDSSVCGCDDCPGYAPLPKMNPFLSCGNQYSAAHGNFQHVISTVVPKNADGTPNPQLSTHQILFDRLSEDEHGKEVGAAVQKAKQCILQGAQLLRQALGAKQRTLVHCEWGQNRSGSICCAFAVLYLGWSASAAIRYFREQNLVERHYSGQSPMRASSAWCGGFHGS